MGIFDFLTGKGAGAVRRTIVKANNKDAQSGDRFSALEQLRTIAASDSPDSAEAVGGLLKRFSFVYSKSIEDEQEKEWVFDSLAALGDKALGALEKSLLSAETISWQLKLLEKIADAETAWPILERVIARNDNQYVRDPSKKTQLVEFLGGLAGDKRVAASLPQYLDDMDETVRFHAVDALVRHKDEDVGLAPLVARLCAPEEESRRIKMRILDGLSELGWPMGERRADVEKAIAGLGAGYSVDAKGGRIKKG